MLIPNNSGTHLSLKNWAVEKKCFKLFNVINPKKKLIFRYHSDTVNLVNDEIMLVKEDILKFPPNSIPPIGTPEFFEWMKNNLLEDYQDGDTVTVIESSSNPN